MTAATAVEWAHAARPYPGESASGDAAIVRLTDDAVLVAVVDALGHGAAAGEAAAVATAALDPFAGEQPAALLARVDRALQGTRGAAVGIARFTPADARLAWIGIGNVAAALVDGGGPPPRPTETLLSLPGVAGEGLPTLRQTSHAARRGAVLVVATDGVDPSFADWLDVSGRPQRIADAVLAAHARPDDDAVVVVARLLEDAA